MCTVSWVREPGGFEIFFNRDERTTRRPATPPEVLERGGVRFVAPADGDFGGTWIAANERGVAVALLNLYEERCDDWQPAACDSSRSRGLLLLDLADAASPGEVRARLAAADLSIYQPFTVVALAPGEPALVAEWNGARLAAAADGDGAMPVISSGVDLAEVTRARRALLASLRERSGGVVGSDLLLGYHASHLPERGSRSVCMHRDDASTVSLTRVRVTAAEVAMAYAEGSPCAGAAPVELRIARAAL